MTEFKQYRRREIAELRPYVEGEQMIGISISVPDKEAGSPKPGDMIARNPKNHMDKWLVAAQYFADNFEQSNMQRRVRHRRRSTFYEIVGEAGLQAEADLADGHPMVVYRGDDDRLWVRSKDEFEDGRFEDVAP